MKSCFWTLFPHVSNVVHCAPDENDRPSERTKCFKITSVYVPVYISELTNIELTIFAQTLSYQKQIFEIWSGNEQLPFKFETTKKVGSSGLVR